MATDEQYTFKRHVVTAAERLWLTEVARSDAFDPRIAKVKLLGKLPNGFNPKRIDARLYQNNRLTLIGLWHVDRQYSLFKAIEVVIEAIRTQIIKTPGVETFKASEISKATELNEEMVERVLYELGQLGSFWSSAGGSKDPTRLSVITLSGDEAYDEYLQFRGIDELLERYYIARNPDRKSSANAFASVFSGWSELVTKLPVEQKSIKPNTAFVLMAMDPQKPELEDVYNAIKDVCREFEINAYRADDIQHQDRITDLVLQEIKTCEYLIADLSYERPNVYYEVGFAHAVNKKPILFRRSGTRLHFDLSVHNVPEFKNTTELRDLLRKRLEAILGRAGKPA